MFTESFRVGCSFPGVARDNDSPIFVTRGVR